MGPKPGFQSLRGSETQLKAFCPPNRMKALRTANWKRLPESCTNDANCPDDLQNARFEMEFRLLGVYAMRAWLEEVMKFVLVTLVLTSATAWSQAANPGHSSRYASVGKKSGGSAVNTPPPKTEPLAAQLAKIEQQGAHVPSSPAAHSAASAKPVFPKAPATQSKNRPMKFTPKSQPTRAGQAH